MHQSDREASNAFAEYHLKILSQLVPIKCLPYFNLQQHPWLQIIIHKSQPNLNLTFRSHHKIFIRRSWYSVVPSLDATIMLSHQESDKRTRTSY